MTDSKTQTTPICGEAIETAEAKNLFEMLKPSLTKENADRAIESIAASSLGGGIQMGVSLRLIEMICSWQMENAP